MYRVFHKANAFNMLGVKSWREVSPLRVEPKHAFPTPPSPPRFAEVDLSRQQNSVIAPLDPPPILIQFKRARLAWEPILSKPS
jgi:hypothetical protein